MVGIVKQALEIEFSKVVEGMAGDGAKLVTDDVLSLGLDDGVFFERGGFGGREDTVEAPQDGERQNDLAILVPFIRAPEQIAYAPDKAGDL